MRLIDQQFLKTPFFGSRKLTAFLGTTMLKGAAQNVGKNGKGKKR